MIRFVIPGRVGGKGRPRAYVGKDARIHTYTPAKTSADEAVVRHFAAEAMREYGRGMLAGPLRLVVTVWQNHPQSWSKKRKQERWITGRPDLDNCLKLLADSCNKIVYSDDAQISMLVARRMFTDKAECVEVEISECWPSELLEYVRDAHPNQR